jgi:hypothetical protein
MAESQVNRHALAFIFITMLVDTIGLGSILAGSLCLARSAVVFAWVRKQPRSAAG